MIKKITAIIPAFNEEATVRGVAKACLKTPEVDQVIVISDGSSDNTVAQAKSIKDKRLTVVDLPKNRGKGYAVAQGIKIAKNDILLFMDADFINLKPYHLSSLVVPVLSKQVDMAIGPNFVWERSILQGTLSIPLCGQRCLKKKDLLPHLKEIEKSKYGLEILLNNIFRKKRVIVVPIISEKKLHLLKHEKQKNWVAKYVQEFWEITQMSTKNKSKEYREKLKKELGKELSSYLKVNIKKIKEYLGEDEDPS